MYKLNSKKQHLTAEKFYCFAQMSIKHCRTSHLTYMPGRKIYNSCATVVAITDNNSFNFLYSPKKALSRIISLAVKDAPAMNAYVAAPGGHGPFPAIILFHDAFGIHIGIRKLADQLALDGFVVIVPGLFHRTAPQGFEARPYQVSLAMPHVNALKPNQVEADMQAAVKWVRNQENVDGSRVAALGFSLGGRFAFAAHSAFGLTSGVSFYPSMLQTEISRIANLSGTHLFVIAGADEAAQNAQTAAVIEAMRTSGKPYADITISGAAGGFIFEGYSSYHEGYAKASWAFTKEFLKSKLR
jgi:carboxymethylenebutenolidase